MLYDDNSEFFLAGDETGVLALHGFSGGPAELRGLADYLNRAGRTVLAPRLPGHGTMPEDLARVTWRDWLVAAEEGLDRLSLRCSRMYIVGHSAGSLLAIALAADRPVAGLVAGSPPLFRFDWRWLLLPIARFVRPWFVISGGTDPSAFRPPYTARAYPRVPTASLQQLLRLVARARSVAPQVYARTLVLQGRQDQLIPAGAGAELLARLGSSEKQLLWFEHSGHMLPLDADREAVWRTVSEFTT